jgi:multidrug transporter EmrE-like cation transporter
MRYVFLVISAILASGGQLCLKKSASGYADINSNNIFQYFLHLVTDPFSWFAVLCYGFSFAIYMIALNKVDLGIARSFNALSYMLVILFSVIIFKDSITLYKIIGVALIAAGIIFISLPK